MHLIRHFGTLPDQPASIQVMDHRCKLSNLGRCWILHGTFLFSDVARSRFLPGELRITPAESSAQAIGSLAIEMKSQEYLAFVVMEARFLKSGVLALSACNFQ